MRNLVRFLVITILTGIIYMGIEIIYRGKTHWTMMIVAGLSVYIIGLLDEDKRIKLKIYQQCLMGAAIATILEFVSGIILNILLGLNIWSYEGQWGNILGQVCPLFMLFWFLIIPIGIFADNYIRFKLFDEEKCENLIKYYISLFTLQ